MTIKYRKKEWPAPGMQPFGSRPESRGKHELGSYAEWMGPSGSTDYTYGPQLGEIAAQLEVIHNPAASSTRYPPKAMMEPDTDPENPYDVNEWWPAPGQIPLISHRSNPAYSVATGMGSTKEARAAAMNLIGLAANDAMKRGQQLLPSRNLSSYSLPMVQKLSERGAVDPANVATAQGNDSQFWAQPSTDNVQAWSANHGYSDIGDEELAAGRRTLRSVLGRNRPSGEQQTLF